MGTCVAAILVLLYSVVESAPACIMALGKDGYYYAVAPLFAILGAVLVVAHHELAGDATVCETEERHLNEI